MDYQAPECPIDFPAMLRDSILKDVALHGEIHRCLLDVANAFDGWDNSQIDAWCVEHDLVIIAQNGRIVIRRVRDLSEFAPQVSRWVQEYVQPLLETDRATRIRAEVEAMDWPEVIEG
jgi:hypothetical protein